MADAMIEAQMWWRWSMGSTRRKAAMTDYKQQPWEIYALNF